MKKIFTMTTALVISSLTFLSNAADVVLAGYEKPMGQEPITETVFCETPPKPMILFTGVVANPVKDATMNNTNNCYQVKLDANHDWWAQFLNFRLTDGINITEANRYLHILHYRQKLNDNWMISLNTDWTLPDSDIGKTRFQGNSAREGVWEDIVIDLKHLIDNSIPLTKFGFGVSMDWSGARDNPGADYYFDEIILNNNPLPRGLNILPDTEMLLFPGNTASYTKWVKNLDTQNAESTTAIVDNPFTTQMDVLNSPKIMKFNKSASAAWWAGPKFKLPGVLKVRQNGARSYLHVMVNIPTMEAGKDYYVIQLNAKDFNGSQEDSGDAIKYWADDKGKWKDCVFELLTINMVSEFTVRFDVRRNAEDALINSPAGEFYLDAAAINSSAVERTVVTAPTTALKNLLAANIDVYSKGDIIVVKGDILSAEAYNVVGKLISKVKSANSVANLKVATKGIYIVKIASADGEIYSTKVVVE